jgi:hypothetical protein
MTPPADIVKTATFPLDVALEAEKKRAALPYTPFRPNSSLPIMGPDGKTIIGWQTAPAGPTIGPGPPTADQQPTQQIVYPATTPGGAPAVVPIPGPSGLSPEQTASGTATGTNRANLGGFPGTPFASQSGAPGPASQQPVVVGGVPLRPAPPAAKLPEGTMVTPNGSYLPSVNQQFMPQSAKEVEQALPKWQATGEGWSQGVDMARTTEMRLETMYRAYQMLESGAYTTHVGEFLNLMSFLGIDPAKVSNKPLKDIQLAMHENILTSLPVVKESTPRPTQFEFKTYSQNREHPDLTPAANMQMLGEDLAQARQIQYRARDWNTAQQQGWRNADSFNTVWSNLNPVTAEAERVKSELGPTKGTPGFQQQAPIPSQYPAGTSQIGTSNGRPVYQLPNGQKVW